ncbi:DNA-directed RNA polymerase subunit K [Candidatus Pacearchaeota archaeon CG10_big_fil_rev_8_21_14_0_10_32_42]|nr:MAG: DNA-directed RNA polymerase subunit K [Candidatus Pacearchaeota archaeon CG10_big_fil_rev_8_21_14_0_10_32_42]
MTPQIFTKYERARILGARALQIAMNAPLLLKIKKEDLEKIGFDALKIAEIELNSDVLPISIHKPMPKKREGKLKRTKTPQMEDAEKEKSEEKLEKEIIEEGEIMELVKPEDEEEDFGGENGSDED